MTLYSFLPSVKAENRRFSRGSYVRYANAGWEVGNVVRKDHYNHYYYVLRNGSFMMNVRSDLLAKHN